MTYGKERAEHLTVKVAPQHGGTPGGKVTIKAGKTTVCIVALGSGKGSCALTARKLRVGTHALVAVYPGNSDFTSSAPPRETLRVVKQHRAADRSAPFTGHAIFSAGRSTKPGSVRYAATTGPLIPHGYQGSFDRKTVSHVLAPIGSEPIIPWLGESAAAWSVPTTALVIARDESRRVRCAAEPAGTSRRGRRHG